MVEVDVVVIVVCIVDVIVVLIRSVNSFRVDEKQFTLYRWPPSS